MSVRVLTGDCRDMLATLPDASVQAVVTSPPYFGLRDYGVDGQIGLEQTPDAYVAEMVAVFREVRRVLRDDGTVWLNLGDSYAATMKGSGGTNPQVGGGKRHILEGQNFGARKFGMGDAKPKDLLGIPWMVAFALRADGWWLRSAIIWAKPNPMPESCRDRCTSSHEHVFMLSKRSTYFYDASAVAEPAETEVGEPRPNAYARHVQSGGKESQRLGTAVGPTRNLRNVWTIATRPEGISHFALMPPDLAERCIKAGTSERGQCPHCAAPWARVVEKPDFSQQPKRATSKDAHLRNGDRTSAGQAWQEWRNANPDKMLGWSPTCTCPEHKPVPQTVLDPFGGAGTTGLVADRLGRNAVLIELNPQYADLARERLRGDCPMFAEVA